MPVTITLYDHVRAKFADGSFAVGDAYKIALYTALASLPASTTKAAAEVGGVQVATANGYTQDAKALTGVAVTSVATSNAKFDADDVTWTASGGSITANYALIYNDTDANDPPVARADFGGTFVALNGAEFKVIWDATGIITFGA